jgi:hypothetical protein
MSFIVRRAELSIKWGFKYEEESRVSSRRIKIPRQDLFFLLKKAREEKLREDE